MYKIPSKVVRYIMPNYIKFFFCAALFFIISNCTSNKTYTRLSQDFRQVEVFNQDKKKVKTYYQLFNKKTYHWLDVTCNFKKKDFIRRENCELTQLSKSFIKNQESKNTLAKSNENKASNKITSLNERNSNSNSNNNGNNSQAPSNNPPNLPSNNPVVNPNPPPNANDPWHN